jgi:rRNA maturation RNase YbeY
MPYVFQCAVLTECVCFLQAKEGGVEFRDEMRVLLLHGFLHLLGYDHETNDEDMVSIIVTW